MSPPRVFDIFLRYLGEIVGFDPSLVLHAPGADGSSTVDQRGLTSKSQSSPSRRHIRAQLVAGPLRKSADFSDSFLAPNRAHHAHPRRASVVREHLTAPRDIQLRIKERHQPQSGPKFLFDSWP